MTNSSRVASDLHRRPSNGPVEVVAFDIMNFFHRDSGPQQFRSHFGKRGNKMDRTLKRTVIVK